MPNVRGTKYSYTPKGMKAAEAARKKKQNGKKKMPAFLKKK
jgi:hypothetical protein